MMLLKKLVYLLLPFMWTEISCQETSSVSQVGKGRVGGECEGCEAVYESPITFEKLTHRATLPDYSIAGTSLRIHGIVYKADGKTPASNVVLYVYHTDHTGVYPVKGNEKGWERRHGYLRGWMKTDENGAYELLTKRPAPYPGGGNPAHIHCIVKEPGVNEYYIGDFLFVD